MICFFLWKDVKHLGLAAARRRSWNKIESLTSYSLHDLYKLTPGSKWFASLLNDLAGGVYGRYSCGHQGAAHDNKLKRKIVFIQAKYLIENALY